MPLTLCAPPVALGSVVWVATAQQPAGGSLGSLQNRLPPKVLATQLIEGHA